jgi:hypothetical protein
VTCVLSARSALGGALVLVSLAGARARAQDSSTKLVEVEGHFGYTAVELEKWANRTNINYRDPRALGINARWFITRLGRARTRVGLEVASRRLFRYEITGPFVREKYVVASQHIGVVLRLRESPKINWDGGMGFDFFGGYSLPSFHTQGTYVLFDRGKFRVPLGGRMDAILNEQSMALSMSIVSGAAFKF